MHVANDANLTGDLQAPVPGPSSGNSSSSPTTGEVNLYADPDTFGTETPILFADCEGLRGSKPIASKYQTKWHQFGTSYIVSKRNGLDADRDTAVKELYPKFLYLFSDVVCMVTRNSNTFVQVAREVLEWGRVGAHGSVNQNALPVLVIVVIGANKPTPLEGWLSDDENLDAVTKSFFENIDEEIATDTALKNLAAEVRYRVVLAHVLVFDCAERSIFKAPPLFVIT